MIDSLEIIQIVANILLFVSIMASPILILMTALPVPLQVLAYCFRPNYATDTLGQALGGTIGEPFYADFRILAVMTLLSLAIMTLSILATIIVRQKVKL